MTYFLGMSLFCIQGTQSPSIVSDRFSGFCFGLHPGTLDRVFEKTKLQNPIYVEISLEFSLQRPLHDLFSGNVIVLHSGHSVALSSPQLCFGIDFQGFVLGSTQ